MKKILFILVMLGVTVLSYGQRTTRNQDNQIVVQKDSVAFYQVTFQTPNGDSTIWYGKQTIVTLDASGLPTAQVIDFPIGDNATLDNFMKARYVQMSNLEAARYSAVTNNYEKKSQDNIKAQYQTRFGKDIDTEMETLFFDGIAGNYSMIENGITTNAEIKRQGEGAAVVQPSKGKSFVLLFKGRSKFILNNYYGQGQDAVLRLSGPNTYSTLEGDLILKKK